MFKHRLAKAIKDLNLKQSQIAGLTGKSKASISQYLSGQQLPSEATQREIAVALGLDENYFTAPDEPVVTVAPKRYGCIRRLTVKEAATLLGVDKVTVSKGLQQGVFPWGYAIKTTERSWAYIINADRFSEIEGVEI